MAKNPQKWHKIAYKKKLRFFFKQAKNFEDLWNYEK